MMRQVYAGHGVRFRYPDGWEVSEQQDENQVSITLTSPETSFWTVTLLAGRPDPDATLAAVLDAFREEYDELDVYPSKARLCRRPTVAFDVDFICLELLNVARIRATRMADLTLLVLFQGTDAEFERTGPILEKITGSLMFGAAGEPEYDEDVPLS
jgi:hypothetical protein